MKNKIVVFVLFIFLILSILSILILYDYNTKLESQLQLRDNLIQKNEKVDSTIVEKTKDYAQTIKEFQTEVLFERDGKTITSSEIVKIVNGLLEDNSKLRDSIYNSNKSSKSQEKLLGDENHKLISRFRDSIDNLVWKLDVIKKNYGINYQIKRISPNKLSLEKEIGMVDSAIVLLPYYRHTLTKKGDTWYIETDKTYKKLKKDLLKKTEIKTE